MTQEYSSTSLRKPSISMVSKFHQVGEAGQFPKHKNHFELRNLLQIRARGTDAPQKPIAS